MEKNSLEENRRFSYFMEENYLEKLHNIRSFTLDQLTDIVIGLGEPKFRAKQVYKWLHEKMVADYSEMTNIPKSLISKLESSYYCKLPVVKREQVSAKDGTRKYLLEMEDGELIECVLMSYSYGKSICVSSQVGCRMGCKFCASTIGGVRRSLEAGEIAGEVYTVSRIIGEKISHIVMMGMGEPLDNYDNTVNFLRVITSENGQNLSVRNITLSTCGIVPNMRKLALEGLPVTLALSLHGSNQTKRESLMPIAKAYKLDEVIDACHFYFEKTGRRISFEYALVKGQNDTDKDVDELAKLIGKSGFHINVIPVNPVANKNFERPSKDHVYAFVSKLTKRGIKVTIRREMGSDIDGACGQLRGKEIGVKELG